MVTDADIERNQDQAEEDLERAAARYHVKAAGKKVCPICGAKVRAGLYHRALLDSEIHYGNHRYVKIVGNHIDTTCLEYFS